MSRALALHARAMQPPTRAAVPWTNNATLAVLWLFLLSCVFDPADRLLGLKVWLFLMAWATTLAGVFTQRTRPGAPRHLLAYVGVFLAIPCLSLAHYAFIGTASPFEGFTLLKGYLLITLAPLLVLNRIDLLQRLCTVLTILAFVIVATYLALQAAPDFYGLLYLIGDTTGIVFLDNRTYGEDVSLLQVYFVTSPMLAVSIAWYSHRARMATLRRARWRAWALVAMHAAAMLLAGTRNNIIVAIMLPITLWFLNTRNKSVVALQGVAATAAMGVVFADELRAFFDPGEVSNSIKLALLDDYARILSDPVTLLWGQGLGSYEWWSAKSTYFYISELTYLELVRNFGLLGTLLMLALLLYPIWHAFAISRSRGERALTVGYAFYLVMCMSNPNLFSSMGILILCIALARIHLPTADRNPA